MNRLIAVGIGIAIIAIVGLGFGFNSSIENDVQKETESIPQDVEDDEQKFSLELSDEVITSESPQDEDDGEKFSLKLSDKVITSENP